jgi:hypothetical protein
LNAAVDGVELVDVGSREADGPSTLIAGHHCSDQLHSVDLNHDGSPRTGFRGRFLGIVFAGDRVECGGIVTAIDPDGARATLELTATVDRRPVMAAEAVVVLPNTV